MKKSRKGGNAAETILLAAADAIGMICRGACTLDDYLDFHAPPDHRRTVEHLLLAFFRHRRFFQDELKKIASREPDPQIKNLILSAFTQIRFQNRIAMQSAVSVAVDAAKKYRADKFVNAVLRKFAAAGTPLPDDAKFCPVCGSPAPIAEEPSEPVDAPVEAAPAAVSQPEETAAPVVVPAVSVPSPTMSKRHFPKKTKDSTTASVISETSTTTLT